MQGRWLVEGAWATGSIDGPGEEDVERCMIGGWQQCKEAGPALPQLLPKGLQRGRSQCSFLQSPLVACPDMKD